MKISTHIIQTLLIGVLFVPLFNAVDFSVIMIYLIFFGLFCGAVYPDTDCPQSRIFKIKQDYSRVGWQSSYKEYQSKQNAKAVYNTFLLSYSMMLIFVGYTLRYLFYYPSYGIVYLINKKWVKEEPIKDEHRGISHTLLGLFVVSVLFFIMLLFANLYLGVAAPLIFCVVPSVAFFTGGNLHLLQDSISKWGIMWLYPFRTTTVSGDYSAFRSDARMVFFLFALIVSNALVFFLSDYVKDNFPKLFSTSTIFLPIFFLSLCFAGLLLSCNTRIN